MGRHGAGRRRAGGQRPEHGAGEGGEDSDDTVVESELRRILAERAAGAAPSEAPYEAIVRQGRSARRRGRTLLGAGAAVLVAVPCMVVGAQLGWPEGEGGASTEARTSSPAPPSVPASGTAGTTDAGAPAEQPKGPSEPARQLLDGITEEQAGRTLARCLEDWQEEGRFEPPPTEIADLRILLAWVSQGDDNRGHEPIRQVLAVSDDPGARPHVQLVCGERDEGTGVVGRQVATGRASESGPPVRPEPGARRHYRPAPGSWTAPFRWAHFGVVDPEVARVTVEYAGAREEAVVEAGYFAVAGMGEAVGEESPVIKGYGADGTLLYDSAEAPAAGHG
ncbi:hypothetical protein [Streptomyces marincola]|nr:hypothetical protein [Streptomyces marincola]